MAGRGRGPVDDALRRRARALGARTVDLAPTASGAKCLLTDDGTLRAWLHGGRAGAVLLRPDRVVMGGSSAR